MKRNSQLLSIWRGVGRLYCARTHMKFLFFSKKTKTPFRLLNILSFYYEYYS